MPDSKVAFVKSKSDGCINEGASRHFWHDYDEDLKDPLIDGVVEYAREKMLFQKNNPFEYSFPVAAHEFFLWAESRVIEAEKEIVNFLEDGLLVWNEVNRDCYINLIENNLKCRIDLSDKCALLIAAVNSASNAANNEARADQAAFERGYISKKITAASASTAENYRKFLKEVQEVGVDIDIKIFNFKKYVEQELKKIENSNKVDANNSDMHLDRGIAIFKDLDFEEAVPVVFEPGNKCCNELNCEVVVDLNNDCAEDYLLNENEEILSYISDVVVIGSEDY